MEKQVEALIPTPWGNFKMQAYAEQVDEPMPHLALIHESFSTDQPTVVRIHSECITGDLFGSKRCDCGEQLERALELSAKEGGVVIYLRQEGRGIGLINKLKAYNLQDEGMNTADANTHLGLEVDDRGYEIAVKMLENIGIRSIRLMTNNPDKISAIEKSSLNLVERLPIIIKARKENKGYLTTKKELMGHLIRSPKTAKAYAGLTSGIWHSSSDFLPQTVQSPSLDLSIGLFDAQDPLKVLSCNDLSQVDHDKGKSKDKRK